MNPVRNYSKNSRISINPQKNKEDINNMSSKKNKLVGISNGVKPKGLIQIYTGDGKGKTTAAVGLAVRAIAHGLKVCYVYFNKDSEHRSTKKKRN